MRTKLSVLLFVLVAAIWFGHQRFLAEPIAGVSGETVCPTGQFMHKEGYCATPWQIIYNCNTRLNERDWETRGIITYKDGRPMCYAVEKEDGSR
jgi:hypothetical protein